MRNIWDEVWQRDAFAAPQLRTSRAERRIRAIAEVIGNTPRLGKVLEVGCGDGSFAAAMARSPSWSIDSYEGYDLSPTAISRAKAKQLPASFQFAISDVLRTPLERDGFDTIFALGLLEHIDTPRDLLGLLRRACKPSSNLVITTSNALSAMHVARLVRQALGRWPYGFQHNYSEPQLRAVLQPEFELVHSSVLHGDWDFPIATFIDLAAHAVSSKCGRYILAIAKPKT